MNGAEAQRIVSFSPPDISELEIAEVAEALRSGWISTYGITGAETTRNTAGK